MAKNLRQYLWIGALGAAAAIAIPAAAQQYPTAEQAPQDRSGQVRNDQDQNRTYGDQDRDRQNGAQEQSRRDQDRTGDNDRDRNPATGDNDRDRNRTTGDNDRDRNRAYDNGNQQWVNTKAYKQGLKDGDHDRSKNKSENLNRHHWKNDQDRQAYEAGYNNAYRGNRAYQGNDHDRDEQPRR